MPPRELDSPSAGRLARPPLERPARAPQQPLQRYRRRRARRLNTGVVHPVRYWIGTRVNPTLARPKWNAWATRPSQTSAVEPTSQEDLPARQWRRINVTLVQPISALAARSRKSALVPSRASTPIRAIIQHSTATGRPSRTVPRNPSLLLDRKAAGSFSCGASRGAFCFHPFRHLRFFTRSCGLSRFISCPHLQCRGHTCRDTFSHTYRWVCRHIRRRFRDYLHGGFDRVFYVDPRSLSVRVSTDLPADTPLGATVAIPAETPWCASSGRPIGIPAEVTEGFQAEMPSCRSIGAGVTVVNFGP